MGQFIDCIDFNIQSSELHLNCPVQLEVRAH